MGTLKLHPVPEEEPAARRGAHQDQRARHLPSDVGEGGEEVPREDTPDGEEGILSQKIIAEPMRKCADGT